MRRLIPLAIGGLALIGGLSACAGDPTSAQSQAQGKSNSLQSKVYTPVNNIEFNNYNDRQKISDDPTTLLWCTAYFPNPNTKPITIPIVGKLTSSNKRPYATSQVQYQSGYNPEIPGPDGMYGASSEYRYGFTPAHVYVDFTNLSTICTTQPTVYQATSTDLVLKVDTGLNTAETAARAALKAGQQSDGTISASAGAQAEQILEAQIAAAAAGAK